MPEPVGAPLETTTQPAITRPQGAPEANSADDKPLADAPDDANTSHNDQPRAFSSPDEMVRDSLAACATAFPSLPAGRARPVIQAPHPILRRIADPVGTLRWDDMATLAADMLATLYASGGRGLAAPQIGVSQRAFVMDAGWKAGAPQPRLFLDPEILDVSTDRTTMEEGCLSIADRIVAVTRPTRVRLRWFTLSGEAIMEDLDDIAARIVQHEMDHLNGVLITDHLTEG